MKVMQGVVQKLFSLLNLVFCILQFQLSRCHIKNLQQLVFLSGGHLELISRPTENVKKEKVKITFTFVMDFWFNLFFIKEDLW